MTSRIMKWVIVLVAWWMEVCAPGGVKPFPTEPFGTVFLGEGMNRSRDGAAFFMRLK